MNFYHKKNEKIVCNLCCHHCILKDKSIGFCGVQQNIEGELINLSFGYPAALHIDPIEKKPLYHFLPSSRSLSLGTVGCNFRCPFCQNWQISQEHSINKNTYYSPQNIVQVALDQKCKSISYTYNEPTVFYQYARSIGLLAKDIGIKNVFVSNGMQSKDVCSDMINWVDGANIDLKSFREDYYKKRLKGSLESIKDNLKFFVDNGIMIEITTLLVNGENDSKEEIEQMAEFIACELGVDTPWHLSAAHPDYKMLDLKRTELATLKQAYQIGKSRGLNFVYLGNVTTDYPTKCPKCNTVLIKRSGFGVVENILQNGVCPKCKTKISGVWK